MKWCIKDASVYYNSAYGSMSLGVGARDKDSKEWETEYIQFSLPNNCDSPIPNDKKNHTLEIKKAIGFLTFYHTKNGETRFKFVVEEVAFGEVDKNNKPKEQPKKSNKKTVKSEEVDLPF